MEEYNQAQYEEMAKVSECLPCGDYTGVDFWGRDGLVFAPKCVLGDSAYLGDNTVFGEQCRIGSYTRIGSNCKIGGFSRLGDFVRLGDNIQFGAGTKFGEHTRYGINASFEDGKIINGVFFKAARVGNLLDDIYFYMGADQVAYARYRDVFFPLRDFLYQIHVLYANTRLERVIEASCDYAQKILPDLLYAQTEPWHYTDLADDTDYQGDETIPSVFLRVSQYAHSFDFYMRKKIK